jgi:hypothetical protein
VENIASGVPENKLRKFSDLKRKRRPMRPPCSMIFAAVRQILPSFYVMAALVAAIHDLLADVTSRRGCPQQVRA